MNPALKIEYFEELFRAIKASFPVNIHGLSAVEITYSATVSGLNQHRTAKRELLPAT